MGYFECTGMLNDPYRSVDYLVGRLSPLTDGAGHVTCECAQATDPHLFLPLYHRYWRLHRYFMECARAIVCLRRRGSSEPNL